MKPSIAPPKMMTVRILEVGDGYGEVMLTEGEVVPFLETERVIDLPHSIDEFASMESTVLYWCYSFSCSR